jgi:hypothetical protein
MVTGKTIGAHNRNCHSKKRVLAMEEQERRTEEKERKRSRLEEELGSQKNSMEDNLSSGGSPVPELKWMEVRLSPYKQNKEESVLVPNGGDESQKKTFSTTIPACYDSQFDNNISTNIEILSGFW